MNFCKKRFLSSSEQIWSSRIFLGHHYVDSPKRYNWMWRFFKRNVCTLGSRRNVQRQHFRRNVWRDATFLLMFSPDSVFFLWWGKSVLLFFCCLQMRRGFHFLLLQQCTNQEEGLLLFRFFFRSRLLHIVVFFSFFIFFVLF